MIPGVLLAVLLQAAPLPPATWKERNHPDMPSLPACDLGKGTRLARSIAELPREVAAEIMRVFGTDGLSDAGGPFNSTDVIDGPVPRRRFIRAYVFQDRSIIWFQTGGFAGGPRTISVIRRYSTTADKARFQTIPGTVFGGNLCAASKAIMAGVLTASP